MKDTYVKNEYYNVKWSISNLEKYISVIMLLVFNVIEILNVMEAKNPDSALLVFLFFDAIAFVVTYIGYRVPCVKWDVNRKKSQEEEDITEKQKKYRTIMNVVIIIVMIWGVAQTIATGSIIMRD